MSRRWQMRDPKTGRLVHLSRVAKVAAMFE